MRRSLLAISAFIFSLSLEAQLRIDSSFVFAGNTKKYSVYLPSSYSTSTPNVMMVGFHPLNTSRWDSKSWCDTLLAFSEMNDLILVCPDGDVDGDVTDSIDYAFTEALMDSMRLWFSIDNNRIYAIGFSVGGEAVYDFGLHHHDQFGGFIPIGPAISGSSFISSVIQNAGRKPFYLVHGGNDSPTAGFYPMLSALYSNCAYVDSILMPGIAHTIDFPNRNQILTRAYKWVDSVNLSPKTGSFSLIAPVSFTSWEIKGFTSLIHSFFWERNSIADSCGVLKYEFIADVASGNFSNPILRIPSDNNGVDTSLTFTNLEMDSVLIDLGVPINGSITLIWTVRSDLLGKYSDTAKSFTIVISRKKVGFDILSPTNNNRVELVNGNVKFFDWEDLTHYTPVTYHLELDDTSGDFSNPLASYLSSNSGANSLVNLPHESIYYDLMFNSGKKIGDSILVKWKVSAEEGQYKEYSFSERLIWFKRGEVGFKLFSPIDNSILQSKKGTDYVFVWDSVLLPDIRYQWLMDTLGIDLHDTAAVILSSNNTGLDSRIDVTFELLDTLMNFYGIDYLDTLFIHWTSRVKDSIKEEYALNTYQAVIIRALPVGIEKENERGAVLMAFPNPASEEVTLFWPSDLFFPRIRLFDGNGRICKDIPVNSAEGSVKIDIGDLRPGSYILTLESPSFKLNKVLIVR